jgi:hypothetical protein
MTRLLPFAGIAVALLLSACSAPQDTPETEIVRPVLTTVATLFPARPSGRLSARSSRASRQR